MSAAMREDAHCVIGASVCVPMTVRIVTACPHDHSPDKEGSASSRDWAEARTG